MLTSMLSWFTPTSLFLLLNLMIGVIVLSSRYGNRKRPQHQQQLQQQEEQLGLFKFEQPNPETQYAAPQHANLDNSTELNRTPSQQLERSPSLLDRIRSINFSHYKFEQSTNPEPQSGESAEQHSGSSQIDRDSPVGLARAPSLLERLKSLDFPFYRSEHADPESKIYKPEESKREAHDPSSRQENLVHRSKSNPSNGARVNQHEKIKKSTSEKSRLRGGVEGNDDEGPATPRVEKTRSFGGDEAVDVKADDFINKFKQQLRLQRLDSLLRYKEMLKRN